MVPLNIFTLLLPEHTCSIQQVVLLADQIDSLELRILVWKGGSVLVRDPDTRRLTMTKSNRSAETSL